MPHTRSFNFKNQIQQDEKNLNSILARQVADAIGILIKKGLIEYLFVSDIAKKYGSTRQLWDRLIKQKKIPYYQYKGGRFTLNIYVEDYLTRKYGIDYLRRLNESRDDLKKAYNESKKNGAVHCPKCGELTLKFKIDANGGDAITAINAYCEDCRFSLSYAKNHGTW